MSIADYYRLLELTPAASIDEIKAAYRRLARQYHPDAHSQDKLANDKFIALTEAYQQLISLARQARSSDASKVPTATATTPQPAPDIKVVRKPVPQSPPLSLAHEQLKWNTYRELQQLWKHKRFLKAIALAETLAQRIPQDAEIRSWQASAYQRWGRQLIQDRQQEKARVYLQRALKTSPHNRSLWLEVERDFRALEKIFR